MVIKLLRPILISLVVGLAFRVVTDQIRKRAAAASS
jgi:hypothetical protein